MQLLTEQNLLPEEIQGHAMNHDYYISSCHTDLMVLLTTLQQHYKMIHSVFTRVDCTRNKIHSHTTNGTKQKHYEEVVPAPCAANCLFYFIC
jgi:hypothetical protein